MQQTLCRSKNKSYIFIDVFEVGTLPPWMMTPLYEWKTSLMGGEFSLGGDTFPWGWSGQPKEVGHHQREEFPNKDGG